MDYDIIWFFDLKQLQRGQIQAVNANIHRPVSVQIIPVHANATREAPKVTTRDTTLEALLASECNAGSASIVMASAKDANEWNVVLAPSQCASTGCTTNNINVTTTTTPSLTTISWVWPLIVFVNLLLAGLGIFLIVTVVRRKKLFGPTPSRTVILPMLEVQSRHEPGSQPPNRGSNDIAVLGSPPSYQDAVGGQREEALAAVAAAWARDRTRHDAMDTLEVAPDAPVQPAPPAHAAQATAANDNISPSPAPAAAALPATDTGDTDLESQTPLDSGNLDIPGASGPDEAPERPSSTSKVREERRQEYAPVDDHMWQV